VRPISLPKRRNYEAAWRILLPVRQGSIREDERQVIPISDDQRTMRAPVMTYAIIAANVFAWLYFQGAGLNEPQLAASVCNFGLVPGELTHLARLGTAVPLGDGLACVVDNERINILTPLTSLFLHGSWTHLLGNMLYFWVFGNNIEDSMGSTRFFFFYLICGLAASAAHILVQPGSPVPTVGASGAISGIMGAYLILFPSVRVRMFFPPFFLFRIRAWLVLIWWFATQFLSALPEISSMRPEVSSGVAFWAHVGGFIAGVLLVKVFENPRLVAQRSVPA
jgi:membrane associated rhomboid family serine protease